MSLKGQKILKHGPLKASDLASGDTIFQKLRFTEANEIELKAIGDNIPDGYVAGWASTPDLDTYSHVVATGAFSESMQRRGLQGPKGIKFLQSHEWTRPLGAIKVLEYRGDRLWIEAQLNLEISYAKDLYLALKDTGGMSFSVGFFLEDYSFKKDENDRDYLYIERGDLFEVSVVVFPGNEDATMEFVKGRDSEPKTIAELERALVAKGYVTSRNEAQRLTAQYKKLLQVEAPEAKTTEPVLATESMTKALDLVAEMKAMLIKNN